MTDKEKVAICEKISENKMKLIDLANELKDNSNLTTQLKMENEEHLTLLEAGLEAEESLYEFVDTGVVFYFRHKERQNDT
jgi:hypothetical protein